jgi:hypothetical protein
LPVGASLHRTMAESARADDGWKSHRAGKRRAAGRGHDSPYAKGNFSFERVICDWRTRIAVLDLRLKK